MMQLHNYKESAKPYVGILDRSCQRWGYSQLRAFTQIAAESAWSASARSSVGAIGLCQIMPDTAATWGCDPADPASAIDALVRNMAEYTRTYTRAIARGQFRGSGASSFALALSAYNAGPGAVERYNGIPGYTETEQYVALITATVQHAIPFWASFWKELLA